LLWIRPVAWLESGRVLFSAKLGDATNIWSMGMNADGVTSGVPQRVTSGPGIDRHPSPRESGGLFDVAFEVETANMDVWRVPLNANGVNDGSPKLLKFGMGAISSPSISSDGTRMAFATRLSNGLAIRIYDPMKATTDTADTLRVYDSSRPRLSGNGQAVAYGDGKKVYVAHIAGGEKEVLCDHCSPPTHISADGRQVLVEAADEEDQTQICSSSEHCRPLIPWAGKKLLKQSGARFSPDGRWVVFSGSRFDSPGRHIWITPLRESGTVAEQDLIPLTAGPAADLEPFWSPDGRTIFFLSDRDGFLCVYGRHVKPETAQPTGSVFRVFDAHQARWTIDSPTAAPADIGLSATRDSLVLMMTTRQANIWLGTNLTRQR
jgi:Tol biopolymer transport system component